MSEYSAVFPLEGGRDTRSHAKICFSKLERLLVFGVLQLPVLKNDARYWKIEMTFARIAPRPADGVTDNVRKRAPRRY